MANFVENESESMSKLKFRLTTLIIIVLLAGMAALQAASLKNMYDERMRDFERKVVSAMQRSAYEELTIRRNSIMFEQTLNLNSDSLSVFLGEVADSITQLYDKYTKLSRLEKLKALYKLKDLEKLEDLDPSSIFGGFSYGTQSGQINNNINIDIIVDSTGSTSTRTTVGYNRDSDSAEHGHRSDQPMAATVFDLSDYLAHYIPAINIEQDINTSQLNFKVLAERLRDNLALAGIAQDYCMTVDDDTFGSEIHVVNGLRYAIPINVKRDHQADFVVEIANPNKAFIKDMRYLIVSAAAIVLLIAAVCFYLQYALFRQKSLARIKADFTHNITHELKTPIAVAYAANDALANFDADDDPQKRKRYLAVVGNQLSLLSAMVERILTMSSEESDDFRLSPSECDAEELFSKLREQFLLKTDKPTTITIGIVPKPLRFRADRLHLSNILGNLVDNAIKYSGESVDITLSAALDGGRVVLSVEDNGFGIPQSSIGQIFDKFYRVPTGERHDVKGFGLGLYYVKLIVEKHGGTIAVRSRVGRGTTFTIKLPYDGR